MGHAHPANVRVHDEASFGERLADRTVRRIGTWRFLLAQSAGIVLWIVAVVVFGWRVDNRQLTILNLLLSCQAAVTGPLLLLASNRQATHDRLRAEADHERLSDIHALVAANAARETACTGR